VQEVIIRTNYGKNIGLGHLYRTLKLANELKKYYKVTFVVDKKSKITKAILKYQVIELYKNSIFKNQADDANLLIKKINKKNIKFIIIDDYRIGFNWEKKFFKSYKIIVFDDLNTMKHKCHYLIDAKWCGEYTYKRYENLVPKNCARLLGPKYVIINPKLNKKKPKKNVLIYFGGAGDFSKYNKLILQFCNVNKALNNKIKLDLVIGPLAYNFKKIIDLKNKFNFLNIIINKFDLSIYLNRCKFAFSTSSSIIYELNNLNIPTCLFSVAKNQQNKMTDFEDLGFYLNINLKNLENSNNSQLLFTSFLTNLNRIKKMQSKKKIAIDKKGVRRIVNILDNNNNNIVHKIENLKKKSDHKNGFFKINDQFINRYLELRNKYENRKNSLNQSLIHEHNHYIWWLNSYNLIEKYYYYNHKILSIFYHQKIKINKLVYWYGGWMTGEVEPKFFDIILFLKFQINITFKKQNLPWIAIIKKKNKFVYLINKKLKFNNIKDQNLINGIKKKFNILEENKYHFLIK
jgi:UDP-2,4-diacetamido-2,4,6-trideoxy-beta-L-altropyranose hydrolase